MRLRKDKGDGDGAAAAPPDAGARVEDPAAPHGDPLSPAALPKTDAAPPSPDARVESPESPEPTEPAKVLASPPSAASRVDAPPPEPGQLVSAAPPAAAAIACPQCGSPAEPGQEICIVCGSRIAPGPVAATGRDWKLPAALAGLGVLLIGVAIAFGVVQLTRDDDVKKDDVADLSPTTTAPPANPAPAPPPPATGTPTTPDIPPATQEPQPQDPDTDTTPDTSPSPSSSGPAEWPEGKSAYTVVLVSATNRNAADAKAEQAVKRGIEAGVLRSDDFSSLRPGYWVVFAGQFDSSEEATSAADRYAEQGFGGGYPRQVKPK